MVSKSEREDILNKIEKSAAAPMPIPQEIVTQFTQNFVDRIIRTLLASRLDPFLFVNSYFRIPSEDYQRAFSKGFSFDHKDISGRDTQTHIYTGLNPHYKESVNSSSEVPMENRVELGFSPEKERVNLIRILIGADIMNDWTRISEVMLEAGRIQEDINETLIEYIEGDISKIIAHELTHSMDINYQKDERMMNEYNKIYDVDENTSKEDAMANFSFYYTTREEIKAHINQTISESVTMLNRLGIEILLSKGFQEFFDFTSDTYHVMKKYLEVVPGDEDKRIMGRTLKKRKEDAWRKYLQSLYTWWERAMEQSQDRMKTSGDKQDLRKYSRKQRRDMIDKIKTTNN